MVGFLDTVLVKRGGTQASSTHGAGAVNHLKYHWAKELPGGVKVGYPWMRQSCPSLSHLHQKNAQDLHGIPGTAGVCRHVGDAHCSGCACILSTQSTYLRHMLVKLILIFLGFPLCSCCRAFTVHDDVG